MQLFSPEALKYLHDQEHDVIVATMSALTLAGMLGMMKGLHSIWKVLSMIQPTFEAHAVEDKRNFAVVNEGLLKVNVRQDMQDVASDRLGNKIDYLGNRVESLSQKMEERNPLFEKMNAHLNSLIDKQVSDAAAD